MNRTQKESWTMLICMALAGIVVFFMFRTGFSSALLMLAFGGVCSVGGIVVPALFKKDAGQTVFDERDRQIELKTTRISFVLSWIVFLWVCLGLWLYFHHRGTETISINMLSVIVWPPAITLFLSHSVIRLILYGKDNRETEGGAA
jgi:hypothetical protein